MLYANISGRHVNVLPPLSYNTFVDLAAVLFVTCVVAWLMASDMQSALDAVHAQNAQMAAAQARMEMMATHDALTGLPNRSLARDRFEQAAAAARRGGHSVAMLFLDLDNFKNVNDTLGHGSGDTLLMQVGDRLAVAAAPRRHGRPPGRRRVPAAGARGRATAPPWPRSPTRSSRA